MKTLLKGLLVVAAALVVTGGALFANTWYGKPLRIGWFYERVFIKYALDDPELLSELRVLEPLGITGHMYKLTDASPAHERAQAARSQPELDTLHAYDRASLSQGEQMSYDILEWFLAAGVEDERWLYYDYPVNQMFGVQNDLPDFMVNVHPLTTAREAEAYVARLDLFDDKFAQVLDGLKLRQSMGIVAPRFVIDEVLAEMRGLIGVTPRANVLYTNFDDKLGKIADLPPDRAAALRADCARAIEQSVYPGYRALIAYFEVVQPQTTESLGVWHLPQGDAFYDWRVRKETTTDLTPEAVHELGLSEVARIEQEMDAILKAQGYPDGTLDERLTRLGAEPRFTYSSDDAGRARVIADFQAIIDEADRTTRDWFNLRPRSGVKVERVPAFKEKTSSAAYYQSAALDDSRPGVFYVNLRDPAEVKKFGMRTLAYHEAIPGHHFQTSIQQQLTGVPTFRKVLPFTAYDEGWALYAERLGQEMGLEADPFDNLGRLRDEMLRAVRLVVDTGIHRKRWTREQAIAYMREKTGLPQADVVSEVERYFVMPGQALAYKVGMLKILELRERARAELGARFDIKAFHDAVLRNGALPLGILEKEIDRWIAANR
jgi:uncharacterized protein (DUF885 family)